MFLVATSLFLFISVVLLRFIVIMVIFLYICDSPVVYDDRTVLVRRKIAPPERATIAIAVGNSATPKIVGQV